MNDDWCSPAGSVLFIPIEGVAAPSASGGARAVLTPRSNQGRSSVSSHARPHGRDRDWRDQRCLLEAVASCTTKLSISMRASLESDDHCRLIRRSTSSGAATVDGAGRPSSRCINGTSRLCFVSGRNSTVSADCLQPIRRAISAWEIPVRCISARTVAFHTSSTGHIGPGGRLCRAICPLISPRA